MKRLISIALILNSTGCSALMMEPPATDAEFTRWHYNPNCTTSYAAPVVDMILATIGAGGAVGAVVADNSTQAQQDPQNQQNIQNVNMMYDVAAIAAGVLAIVELAESIHGANKSSTCRYQKERMAALKAQQEADQKAEAAKQEAGREEAERLRANLAKQEEERLAALAAEQLASWRKAEAEAAEQARQHADQCANSLEERIKHKDTLIAYRQLYVDNQEWVSKNCGNQDRIDPGCAPSYLTPDGTVHPSVCRPHVIGTIYKCKNKDRPKKIDGSSLSDQDAQLGNYVGPEKDALSNIVSKEEMECDQ